MKTSQRKTRRAGGLARAAGLLAILMLLSLGVRASAHHTSAIGYLFQKVGEWESRDLTLVLVATPPRLPDAERARLSPAEAHKRLAGFTHRFQVTVSRKGKTPKPLPGLRVRLRFSGDEWERTFPLHPAMEKGEPAYAANLTLGPRGAYRVVAEARAGGKLLAKAAFSFDYDYESLKEVMNDLQALLAGLGRDALTLGLDGEAVPPRKTARLRKQAARFRALVPWTVNLRAGAAQNLYEEEAAKLLEAAEAIAAAAGRRDPGAVVDGLAAARRACVRCHEIFQEADATGGPPKIPALRPAAGGR